jgi:hypothetical protein
MQRTPTRKSGRNAPHRPIDSGPRSISTVVVAKHLQLATEMMRADAGLHVTVLEIDGGQRTEAKR